MWLKLFKLIFILTALVHLEAILMPRVEKFVIKEYI